MHMKNEQIREMRLKTEATMDAFYNTRNRGGHWCFTGRGSERGYGSHSRSVSRYLCRIGTLSLEVCRLGRQQDQKRSCNATEMEYFHCGEASNFQRDCPVKHKGEMAKIRAAKKLKAYMNLGEKRADVHHRLVGCTTLESKVMLVSTVSDWTAWGVNSGATHYKCNDCEAFRRNSHGSARATVRLGEKSYLQASWQGSVTINGVSITAYFIPKFRVSLLSVARLNATGFQTVFSNGTCTISDRNGRGQ